MASQSKARCELLGPTSIGIQVLMAVATLAGLLIKRNREHPRRRMMVWAYDVSKQVIGALEIHFINLGLGVWRQENIILFSNDKEKLRNDKDGQCDWYFLNLLCDTTIGVPILWMILVLIEHTLIRLDITNIESGNYFPPVSKDESLNVEHERPLFSAFCRQLSIFVGGVTIMKVIVYEFLEHYEKRASWFANLLLGWCDHWPNLQVFLVMFVSPIGLNFFQYFCIDNIIKLPTNCVNFQNWENFEPETLEGAFRDVIDVDTSLQNNRINYGSLSLN